MSRRPKAARMPSPALERAALLGREFSISLLKASGVADDELAAMFADGTLAESPKPAHARFTAAAAAKKIAEGIPWSRARDHHLALGEASRQQRLPAEEVAAH